MTIPLTAQPGWTGQVGVVLIFNGRQACSVLRSSKNKPAWPKLHPLSLRVKTRRKPSGEKARFWSLA